jgi:3-phosphoshikimate 1-carboxyvinyltransferase
LPNFVLKIDKKKMITYQIYAPKQLKTAVSLPSSKSICNRALILHALAHGTQKLENLSDCDDTSVMIRALQKMPETIDIMAAGTAMRFLSAYLAVTPGAHTITGTERMQHRPIKILVDALRELGAGVEYVNEEGFPPLYIKGGHYDGGTLSLPGNVSSQYISALLMIGPTLRNGLTLRLTGEVVSKPYINLTMHLMHQFGATALWTGKQEIRVQPGGYRDIPYFVEGDWSGASYWYEMVALTQDTEAEVYIPGLFHDSMQGDAAIQQLFDKLGVKTEFVTRNGREGIVLTKQPITSERLDYNFVNQPDMAQTFVVTCCLSGIPFHFTGLQSLKIKETDRIAALRRELRKWGYVIGEANDSELFWEGERCDTEEGAAIDTYEDHRMALSFAPACLRKEGVRINHPDVVTKSYPAYWLHLEAAGFTVKEL